MAERIVKLPPRDPKQMGVQWQVVAHAELVGGDRYQLAVERGGRRAMMRLGVPLANDAEKTHWRYQIEMPQAEITQLAIQLLIASQHIEGNTVNAFAAMMQRLHGTMPPPPSQREEPEPAPPAAPEPEPLEPDLGDPDPPPPPLR